MWYKGESMTVFVVQEVPGRNILSAEKFGDLELQPNISDPF